MMKIKFGTSGWRGIIARDFTFENVAVVSQAIADYIKEKEDPSCGVIVGYDTRFASNEFAKVAASVMAANGIKVLLSPAPIPTPAVAAAIRHYKTAGGINITASHNPPMWNGIKFSPPYGGPALPETTSVIEQKANAYIEQKYYIAMDFDEAAKKGLIEITDVSVPYFNLLRKTVNFKVIVKNTPKIVVDCRYGTAVGFFDRILKEEGIDPIIINNKHDPYFGGGSSEPSGDNIKDLVQKVKTENALIGLSVDGDADRFGVVDESGEFVWPNYILALLLDYLIETRGWKDPVVRTVATTHLLDRIAREHSMDVFEVPVGFKFIGKIFENRNGKITLGGEESGGLSVREHLPEKDGILADLLVLEMVSSKGIGIKSLLNHVWEKYGKILVKRLDFHLKESQVEHIWSRVSRGFDTIAGKKVNKVVTLDGFKYLLEGGSWVLFRKSGTEPVVRFYIESTTPEELLKFSEWAQEFFERT